MSFYVHRALLLMLRALAFMPENISEKSGYGKHMKHDGEDIDREAICLTGAHNCVGLSTRGSAPRSPSSRRHCSNVILLSPTEKFSVLST